jgi:hypothetical protein
MLRLQTMAVLPLTLEHSLLSIVRFSGIDLTSDGTASGHAGDAGYLDPFQWPTATDRLFLFDRAENLEGNPLNVAPGAKTSGSPDAAGATPSSNGGPRLNRFDARCQSHGSDFRTQRGCSCEYSCSGRRCYPKFLGCSCAGPKCFGK